MKNKLFIVFASLSMVTFGFADCELAGDVNNDGAVNVLDIVVLANYILSQNPDTPNYNCPLDFGYNGPNILDIITLLNCILTEDCNG